MPIISYFFVFSITGRENSRCFRIKRDYIIKRIFDEAQDAVFKTIGIKKSLDYGAKTLIVVSSLPPHREGMDYANGGIVIENMVLAATDLGIDSWTCSPRD